DANAQARVVLRADGSLDALQAVVTTGAAARAETIAAERQGDFVDDDHQIGFGGPRLAAKVRSQHGSAEVHVGLRLDETHAHAAHGASRDTRLAVALPRVETPNVGEVVDDPPTDVVPSALVLPPGVSEPDDDFHGSGVGFAVAERHGGVRLGRSSAAE